ncbi:3-oxoacyl-[acyl-carrier-protein] reductase FabG [Luteitalea pratensis]|uniref:3-oxoacyl-[acyl-carrier-protein] reductase FabG n=1 Tax=Luteitalea pratensis TaxID=1855912 RepID=A0A143PW63_LUTPR|nr:SDR family oxidoreductase [Luteitalea pratensis]AMY12935.1 3-oxoacyl-[acyl-carrier-protein] reductase FabG [Luteitalea pratensis]
MTLSDKVVLITGGTRMGASLAHACAARGADVALSYAHSAHAIDEVVTSVAATGRRAAAFATDLRVAAACASLVDDVIAWAGQLDVLVCLASVYARVPLDELTPQDWQEQLAVDLDASFHCARAAAAHMRPRGAGHVVLCSDWVAASGRPRYTGYLPYYVAKAGVVALTESLALELAADGVQVNAIAPGPILPAAGTTPEMQAAVMQATPLRHWGGPDVVTHAIMGLLDQEWVTGQVVRVDGGRHLL